MYDKEIYVAQLKTVATAPTRIQNPKAIKEAQTIPHAEHYKTKLVVRDRFYLHQMDVSTAFLNGRLSESIYIGQPTGFRSGSGKLVCKLKSLYGLTQVPRIWYENYLLKMEINGDLERITLSMSQRKDIDHLLDRGTRPGNANAVRNLSKCLTCNKQRTCLLFSMNFLRLVIAFAKRSKKHYAVLDTECLYPKWLRSELGPHAHIANERA
ncbi:putative transposable element [Phytophthora palmivora]|uniref:Transposable element n=1 Tax=Phytophthora palmivora TaxID=4796 RepID=A0A2P4YVN2_9STRA|nr:putative transposable element [Phytophthora palmivora]